MVNVDEVKLRETISRRLGLAMARARIGQRELARQTGATPACINQILSKKRTPTLETMIALAGALGVTEAWIMGKDKRWDGAAS